MNVQVKNNLYGSPNYLYLEYYKSLELGNIDYATLILKDVQFQTLGLNDSGLVINNYLSSNKLKATYYDTYNFNGTNYNTLQVIETDTTTSKKNTIYKIWLAKNEGIVGYESYPSLERWAKQ